MCVIFVQYKLNLKNVTSCTYVLEAYKMCQKAHTSIIK